MSKAQLAEPFSTMESEIIDTLLAGHKEWRSDLAYPESHSDMQGAVRGLLRMFEVKRRTLPFELPIHCDKCHGARKLIYRPDPKVEPFSWKEQTCVCQERSGR